MTALTWEPYRRVLAADIVRLWNRAMGDAFPMSQRLFRQNTEGAPSYDPDDSRVVCRQDDVVGYILTKRFGEDDPLRETMGSAGWIDAIIVDPAWQRQGIGRDLMAWALHRLRGNGAEQVFLGGGLRHFLPGVPAETPGLKDFFGGLDFATLATVYDLRGNLRGFAAPPAASAAVVEAGASVTPCEPEDVPALMAFLRAEFPGRWRFDTERCLALGGAPQDVMILRRSPDVLGFAQIYHRRSAFLGPPIHWHRLMGTHYGGLGPIGIAAGVRGRGLGKALLQLSLQHLAGLGVTDAVIDWTTLLAFYAKVGFTPWKSYARMVC
jgi:predicted N-acetyltransferase YhbS